MQRIVDLVQCNGGFITTAQAMAEGIPRARLSDMVKAGDLERVYRGVYCLADAWEDDLLAAQLRFPKGIFSDLTALHLHNYTDRSPFWHTMTFPRTYNATKVREAGIEVRTCADSVLDLGVVSVKTMFGNMVRAYDLERTLCDMMRGQRVLDDQIVTPAMQTYVTSADCNPIKLLEYARALGVERKMRLYMKVLL